MTCDKADENSHYAHYRNSIFSCIYQSEIWENKWVFEI